MDLCVEGSKLYVDGTCKSSRNLCIMDIFVMMLCSVGYLGMLIYTHVTETSMCRIAWLTKLMLHLPAAGFFFQLSYVIYRLAESNRDSTLCLDYTYDSLTVNLIGTAMKETMLVMVIIFMVRILKVVLIFRSKSLQEELKTRS